VLFNSYEFILVFLPVSFLGFYWLARWGIEPALVWLVIASLFFYGWWNPAYLLLIVASMVANFVIGRLLSRFRQTSKPFAKRATLVTGIGINLGVLAYYKYAGFLAANINAAFGSHLAFGEIVLPLAISFFTFQQIAYLVDAYQGITKEYRFSHYALFVTFFPQLIAGPIVHHGEMLPQFMRAENLKPRVANLSIGVSIFAIGLFKKAVLADGVAQYATPVFLSAAAGQEISFFEAWGGALAYTCQLYFDFSGYSDMAIGAARMFGIRLPLNFHSPYKATNITEFWRRWHMTLSRFLRDYLYIPLGGNRRGRARRYQNLMVTMLLGGLWHGAGWTFVAWGALHGAYLVINHAWHKVRKMSGRWLAGPSVVGRFASWMLTFVAVVVGWVFFRASDFDAAMHMLAGMSGLNGISIPNAIYARLGPLADVLGNLGITSHLGQGRQFVFTYLWVIGLLTIALIMPNTQQIMRRYRPALAGHRTPPGAGITIGKRLFQRLFWRPTTLWAVAIGAIAALGFMALTSVSEFLYFQF
jgi:D-alanyl-lipoteichoic acid acyltransferase DltB (MBOAT superfamily)